VDVRKGVADGLLRSFVQQDPSMHESTSQFDDLVAYTASELRAGATPGSVRADLLNRKLSEELVGRLVAEATARNRQRGVRTGAKYLAIGLGCFVLGTVITGATYASAVRDGGTYFVAIGLFGFGIGYTLGGSIRLVVAAVSGK
jgi:hypothetical protein